MQFIPNARFVYDGVDYQTNSIGFRDREISREKKAGTVRVAVLGDSFVEGMGEKQEDTIPTQLEKILESSMKNEVEVMNCGVRGGSPGHYKFWVRALLPHKPDAFVICVFDNDMDDDACLLLKKAYNRADAWWNQWPGWWKRSSIMSYVMGEMVNLKFKRRRAAVAKAIFNDETFHTADERRRADGDTEAIGSNAFGFASVPLKWEAHWPRTEANLDEIVALLRREGVPVMIVYIPSHQLLMKNHVFNQWLSTWAIKRGVPFLNLTGPLRAWHQQPTNPVLYQPVMEHFNALGLRLAATWIVPELRKLLD
jgi:lysophospholipase L1-like esterase